MPPASHRTSKQRHWEARVEIRVANRPVVALLPTDRRVEVGLVMPVIGRVVDVSVQPATACTALADAARRAREPMTSVDATARRMLAEVAGKAGAWSPPADQSLPGAFGGVAFPLLAAAYDAGAGALGEVPRWAVPVLTSMTIGEGAVASFGTKATRPVRRALVDAIGPLPSGELDLTVLCLALMGREVLEPDRLARVLACDRVSHAGCQLPDPAAVRATRGVLRDWGPQRSERVLIDAATSDGGLTLLLDTIGYALQLGDHGPAHPLPNRLRELHDVHRALMRTATAPAAPPIEPPAAAVPPARARRAPRAPHPVLPPVPAVGRVQPDTPIHVSAPILGLERRRGGDLGFVLPRTVGDLVRWGRLLDNCLGDFGPSAAAGRTILVGVLRRNRLTYAIELSPTGAIRQFCGNANRRPSERDRIAVIEQLVAARVLDPVAPANGPWLAGVGGVAAHRAG